MLKQRMFCGCISLSNASLNLVKKCHSNAEAMTDYGSIPLHNASEKGHFGIVNYLFEECYCIVEAKDYKESFYFIIMAI